MAALPDGTAWATGIYTTSSGHTSQALTEHWNGHSWTIVPAADPGSQDDMLYGATGVTDSDVWAVGGYSGPDGFFHPLIEHWNGHNWTVTPVKGVSGDDGVLTAITSAPGEGVWATGQLTSHAPDQQVVLHLVGSSWLVTHGAVRTSGSAVASAYPESIGVSPLGAWLAGNDRAGHAGFSTLVEGPGLGRAPEGADDPESNPARQLSSRDRSRYRRSRRLGGWLQHSGFDGQRGVADRIRIGDRRLEDRPQPGPRCGQQGQYLH